MYTWEWYDWIFLGVIILVVGGVSYFVYGLSQFGKAIIEYEKLQDELDLY